MIYQVGKKQCSNSGRKRNDIAPLESDFMVQPPSLREFSWASQKPVLHIGNLYVSGQSICVFVALSLPMCVAGANKVEGTMSLC